LVRVGATSPAIIEDRRRIHRFTEWILNKEPAQMMVKLRPGLSLVKITVKGGMRRKAYSV
jgi:hypothetical protein